MNKRERMLPLIVGLCCLLPVLLASASQQKAAHKPKVDTSVHCPYCECVFTDDTPDEESDDGDKPGNPRHVEVVDGEAVDAGEELAKAEDNLSQHLVHVVDCDNGGYWETCEHAIERGVLKGTTPKSKWVSCPGHPEKCGEAPEAKNYQPTVRHVGEHVVSEE